MTGGEGEMHRTLLIGLGNRGTAWARAIAGHNRFALHGVSDIHPEVLAHNGDELNIRRENRHLDYHDALASGSYDAAIIVVPNHLHYPVCKEALLCGVHCLVEKPFTERIEHAEELVDIAGDRSLVLVVGQNYRFKPHIRFLSKLIKEQKLGRLGGIEGSFHRYRPPRFEHERVMEYPMLFLQAIHHFDWLLSVLPTPIRDVESHHHRPPWSKWQNPSISQVLFRCEDGITVNYRGSYESQGEITPYDGLWRIEFERGDIMLDVNGTIWQIVQRGEIREPLDGPGQTEKTSESCLLDSLAEAIVRGIESSTSGRNNLQTLRLLFRVAGG